MMLCIHGNECDRCSTCEENLRITTERRIAELPLFDAAFNAAAEEIKDFIQGNTFEHYPVRMVMFKIFSMSKVIAFLGKDEGFELAMKKMRIREFVAIWVADYLKTPKENTEIDWRKL